eukprot:8120278-Alexandrium_andersonii.AAC.1
MGGVPGAGRHACARPPQHANDRQVGRRDGQDSKLLVWGALSSARALHMRQKDGAAVRSWPFYSACPVFDSLGSSAVCRSPGQLL